MIVCSSALDGLMVGVSSSVKDDVAMIRGKASATTAVLSSVKQLRSLHQTITGGCNGGVPVFFLLGCLPVPYARQPGYLVCNLAYLASR